MLPNKANRLIAALRGIPNTYEFSKGDKMISLSCACDRWIGKRSPTLQAILFLQSHWKHWFQGTEFEGLHPQRIDSNYALWIQAPNAILRQKMQFKTDALLKTLHVTFPKITSIYYL